MSVAALTEGAASVDMFMRRPTLPMVDLVRDFETAGHLDHCHELADETKWALSSFLGGFSQSPAEHHFYKAWSYDSFRMHLGSPWQTIGLAGDDDRGHDAQGDVPLRSCLRRNRRPGRHGRSAGTGQNRSRCRPLARPLRAAGG